MRVSERVIEKLKMGGEIFFPFGGNKVQQNSGYAKMAKKHGRLVNPIAANQADIVNWVLYDEITYAAAAVIPQLFRLFVVPIGTGAKTKVNTNLEQVSRLPDPQWFNVTGLSIGFCHNTVPIDIVNFLNTTYMEFWVGGKVYLEGNLDCFPASGGPLATGYSNVTAGAAVYGLTATNGWPSINNMYDCRLPAGLNLGMDRDGNPIMSDGVIGITILQGQTFRIEMKADGGGATLAAANATPYAGVGITIRARLHGILSRGVQ